jgi:hypothetical protein
MRAMPPENQLPDLQQHGHQGPDLLTLYPHGGEREWSSKMWDDWKRDMGEPYVHVGVIADAINGAETASAAIQAIVDIIAEAAPALGQMSRPEDEL